jgi:hypothetical protein
VGGKEKVRKNPGNNENNERRVCLWYPFHNEPPPDAALVARSDVIFNCHETR